MATIADGVTVVVVLAISVDVERVLGSTMVSKIVSVATVAGGVAVVVVLTSSVDVERILGTVIS